MFTDKNESEVEAIAPCRAMVAYQDDRSRGRALVLCDHLMARFWSEITLQFTWWRLDFLTDEMIAAEAGQAAADADILIFSTSEITTATKKWIDSWIARRRQTEGLLVALIGTTETELDWVTPAHVYLESVARRAKVDYLPLVGHAISSGLNSRMELLLGPTHEVSSPREQMLHHRPLPPPWGINE